MEQGSRFFQRIRLRTSSGAPLDLTGYAARMQLRESVDSPTVLVELTTANGFLAITSPATSGELTITIPTGTTTLLDFDTAVYDLELVQPDGEAKRLLEGTVTFSREVTR